MKLWGFRRFVRWGRRPLADFEPIGLVRLRHVRIRLPTLKDVEIEP